MDTSKTLAFLFFFTLLSFSSAAENKEPGSPELLDSLQSAITDAVKTAKDKNPDAPQSKSAEYAAYAPQAVQAIRQSITRGDLSSAQQSLRQIQTMFPDPKITDICSKILVELEKESLARERNYLETVDAAIEKSVDKCFKAREPKELDSLILELSRLSQKNTNYNTSDLTRRTGEKARSAVTFLCRWQDYLMQLKSGNNDAASLILKNLSQENTSYPFVPRSEILSRMKPDDKPNSANPEAGSPPDLEGKTLKDLIAIRKETDLLLNKQRDSQALRQFSQNLEALELAIQQQKSGLVGQAYNYCLNRNMGNKEDSFHNLKQQLLLEVLPAYLNVEDTYPPKQGEMPSGYLQRISKEAQAKSDWQTAWKSLETYRNVVYSQGQGPAWLSADIQGLSLFIVGQNQEKAGQYADAVRTYKRIPALAGQNLPIAQTTERLKTIEKEHPNEFASGIQTQGITYPTRPTLPPNYPPTP